MITSMYLSKNVLMSIPCILLKKSEKLSEIVDLNIQKLFEGINPDSGGVR